MMVRLGFNVLARSVQIHFARAAREVAPGPNRTVFELIRKSQAKLSSQIPLKHLHGSRDSLFGLHAEQEAQMIRRDLGFQQVVLLAVTYIFKHVFD